MNFSNVSERTNDFEHASIPLDQCFLTFLKSGNIFDYMKNLRNTKINDIPRRNKYILENILLSINLMCKIKFKYF